MTTERKPTFRKSDAEEWGTNVRTAIEKGVLRRTASDLAYVGTYEDDDWREFLRDLDRARVDAEGYQP